MMRGGAMERSQEYEGWLAAALRETERRAEALRRAGTMRDDPVPEEPTERAGDTPGAESLAEDDRTKTTGDNAVPHRATQPSRERQIARVRREAGQQPPKTTRTAEE